MIYKKTNIFNELRNKINEKEEYFTKKVGTVKKKQTEILGLKNSITKMSNAHDESTGKRDQMEKKNREHKGRKLDMTQKGKEKELRVLKSDRTLRTV